MERRVSEQPHGGHHPTAYGVPQPVSSLRPTARQVPRWLVVTCLVLGSLTLGGAMAQAATLRRMVAFTPGTPVAVQQAIVAASGSTWVRSLPLVNAAAIQLPAAHPKAALEYFRSRPEVRHVYVDPQFSLEQTAETEGIESAFTTTASPPSGYPWNLQQIARHQLKALVQGHGVEVAVVDTGIDATHPALAGVVLGGYNAVTAPSTVSAAAGEGGDGEGGDGEGGDGEGGDGEGGDGEGGDGEGGDGEGEDSTAYGDCHGHGTQIAGIIAANTIGIAPQAKLHAVRVLNCQGGGLVSDLISGLSWIYDRPQIRVVNLSLGFYKTSPYPLLHQAITALHEAGVVLVAAAGNYRPDCLVAHNGTRQFMINPLGCNTRVKFPARYPEVIAVAATDAADQIAYYSIQGAEVDITAPGGSQHRPVVSTTPRSSSGPGSSDADAGASGEGGDGEGGDGTGAFGGSSGTSIATAHVTGVVALMLSVNPRLAPADVVAILQKTAHALHGSSSSAQGAGRIRVPKAIVEAAKWKGTPPQARKVHVDTGTQIDASVVLDHEVRIGQSTTIEAAATLMEHAAIDDNVTIGTGTTLGKEVHIKQYAVLGNNVTIGHHTTIDEGSRVGALGADMFGTTIGDDAVIKQQAVIGTNVRIGDATEIGDHTRIGDRTTIGNQTKIKAYVVIGQDVVIGQEVEVKEGAVVCAGAVIPDYTRIAEKAKVGRCF